MDASHEKDARTHMARHHHLRMLSDSGRTATLTGTRHAAGAASAGVADPAVTLGRGEIMCSNDDDYT